MTSVLLKPAPVEPALEQLRELRAGTQLSEEEFYLCRAIGDLNPPSDTRTEYAAYLQTFN
jgi:hypothetical protein